MSLTSSQGRSPNGHPVLTPRSPREVPGQGVPRVVGLKVIVGMDAFAPRGGRSESPSRAGPLPRLLPELEFVAVTRSLQAGAPIQPELTRPPKPGLPRPGRRAGGPSPARTEPPACCSARHRLAASTGVPLSLLPTGPPRILAGGASPPRLRVPCTGVNLCFLGAVSPRRAWWGGVLSRWGDPSQRELCCPRPAGYYGTRCI